jgi:murein DD-endopeptidase MepM/ murein hydrolase activator NlpD
MENKEIEKRLRELEKSIPKIKKNKLVLPNKKKAKFVAQLQFYLVLTLLSCFILLVAFPPFFWPINAHVTSEFLFRLKPDSIKKGIEIHHGIDLGSPNGTILSPSAIGIVTSINRSTELGNYIIVNHPFGFSTLYAHLQTINTHLGSIVIPGISNIGFTGNTGRSTGPHLHFSIRIFGYAVPPRVFLIFHTIRKNIIKF